MSPLRLLPLAPRSAAGAHDSQFLGALRSAEGPLPLRALHVDARVVALVAQTTFTQAFVNPHDAPCEAQYTLSLPARAALTGLRVEVAGRVVVAALRERDAACESPDVSPSPTRVTHPEASAHAERIALDVGTLRPGEQATVRFTLVAPLGWEGHEAVFRIPRSHLSHACAETHARTALTVRVAAPRSALAGLRASLPAFATAVDDGARIVSLAPDTHIDRDFVLRIPCAGFEVTPSLVLAPDAEGDEGSYRLTLLPPLTARAAERARDVVFVIERGASMKGWKMAGVRRALARMVDTLDARDRFAVFAFDDLLETPPGFPAEALVVADERARACAVSHLERLEARGRTERSAPLDRAADLFDAAAVDARPGARECIVVFVANGRIRHETRLFRILGPRLAETRIVAVGLDPEATAPSFQRLVALGRTHIEFVASAARLESVMARVRRRVAPAQLRAVTVEATAGLTLLPDTQSPTHAPDLVAGAPLVLCGRYRRDSGVAAPALTVAALDADEHRFHARVAAHEAHPLETPALAASFARAHLADLDDRFVAHRDDTLPARITATSLRYGVSSRFTAFHARDSDSDADGVNPDARARPIVTPLLPLAPHELRRPAPAAPPPATSALAGDAYRRVAPRAPWARHAPAPPRPVPVIPFEILAAASGATPVRAEVAAPVRRGWDLLRRLEPLGDALPAEEPAFTALLVDILRTFEALHALPLDAASFESVRAVLVTLSRLFGHPIPDLATRTALHARITHTLRELVFPRPEPAPEILPLKPLRRRR